LNPHAIGTASATWDADDRLAADIPCVSCGYNLRGLKRSGVCGECGEPIRYSLAGSDLACGAPEWVARLRSGTATLALTLPWLWFPPAWLAFSYGLWRVSAPDPGRVQAGGEAFRSLARAILCALPCLIWYGAVPLTVAYWYANATTLKFSLSTAVVLLSAGLLSLVPPVLALLMWPIAARLHERRLRQAFGLAGPLGAVACLGVVAIGLESVARVRLAGLWEAGRLCAELGVPAFVLLGAALHGTWRALEQAETQSRALRRPVRYWQRPEPGGSGRTAGPARPARP